MAVRTSFSAFGFFLRRYPARTALMLASLLFSGVLEGIGLFTLLPLLSLAEGGQHEPSSLTVGINSFFDALGLTPSFEVLLGFIVATMAAKGLLILLAMRQVGFTTAHVGTELRLDLIRALMKARWGYFVQLPVGSLSNTLSSEATIAPNTFYAACMTLTVGIQVVIYVFVSLVVSFQVALAALVCGSLLLFFFARFVRAAQRAGEDQTMILSSLVRRFADGISGIKPLKAMGREDRLRPLLENETRDLKSAIERHVISRESLNALSEPVMVIFLALGMWISLSLLGIPFAKLLILALLFHRILTRLGAMQINYQKVVSSEPAFWAIRRATEQALQNGESWQGGSIPSFERGIEFYQISFAYGKDWVLRDVNLRIENRGLVGFVGSSGAGKTTLIDLITGLHMPSIGEVRVDGIPLSDLDIGLWRQMIGYVPQEMVLFNDSIRTNVSLGDPEIGKEQVTEALKLAGAWEFVSRLPQGFDTPVGERGVALSGGQRQRISIARALARNPKLLILDEATSALDDKTEKSIYEVIRDLSTRIAVVAISHKGSLNDYADVVYSLDDGRIVHHESQRKLDE